MTTEIGPYQGKVESTDRSERKSGVSISMNTKLFGVSFYQDIPELRDVRVGDDVRLTLEFRSK